MYTYRRRSNKKKIFLIVVVALAVCLLIAYIIGILYYKKHVFANTSIGDVSISNCGPEEVEKRLNSMLDDYSLKIKARNGVTETISSREVGLEYVMNDYGQKLIDEQNAFLWVSNLKKNVIPLTEFSVNYDSSKFQSTISTLRILQVSNMVKPVDAYISDYVSGEGYSIVKEVMGSEIELTSFIEVVGKALKNLEEELDLESVNVYNNPKILSDNKKLKKKVKKYNKLVSAEITYDFGGDTMVIDGDVIHEWMKFTKSGKVSIDEDKVKEFVKSMGQKYDTIFRARSFKTSYGTEVTVEGGDYGWWMNRGKEAEEIINIIKNGEVVERVPEYYQTAAQYGKKDYGDTYVEINLTAQHLFVYKNGKRVLESDFVSGKDTKERRTPVGIYGVTYKERDATLVGEDYETPVSYWMPFNGSVGMHDAVWRSSFGSSIYKASGSHGCINLPFYTAEKIYGIIEKGCPVIVYELPGTASGHTTAQGDEEIAHFVVDLIDRIGPVEKSRIPILEKSLERIKQAYSELSGNQRRYVSNYSKYEQAVKEFKELNG